MTSMTATRISAGPGQGRPQQPNALQTSLTMAWRAVLKIRHEPEQMADAIAIPILFTLLFTYLFGGALSGSTHDYLHFLLPGSRRLARPEPF